ncbi:hypothetical protein RCZ04_07220 [Capnocytophaga sp. HP1101]
MCLLAYSKKQNSREENHIPNELTLQAMREAEAMAKDKNKKKYATIEELIESLKK